MRRRRLAGVFDEADALALIAARATLSAAASEGRMLAVNTDEATATAAAAASGRVWLAVLNTHGRQVLAGEPEAVERAQASLEAAGVRCRPLPVNRAYHTPLMDGARRSLAAKLQGMRLQPPSVPLGCNGTGGWHTEHSAVDADYWAAHVATAVRWADNMEALAGRAPSLVVEVGSGSSLAPLLAEATAPAAEDLRPISTLRHPKVHRAVRLASLATAHVPCRPCPPPPLPTSPHSPHSPPWPPLVPLRWTGPMAWRTKSASARPSVRCGRRACR